MSKYDIFVKLGYLTQSIVNNHFLNPMFGFNKGFDSYKNHIDPSKKRAKESAEKKITFSWQNIREKIFKDDITVNLTKITTNKAIRLLEEKKTTLIKLDKPTTKHLKSLGYIN